METVKILNSTEWCEIHKGEMLGYSKELREKVERLKDREAVFLSHVFEAILKADGFTYENGLDNYNFSIKQSYFIEAYKNYLDVEASKLIDGLEGTVAWCRNNHYAVGCLDIRGVQKHWMQAFCN
ncbi:uncharacterized protein LOC132918953 [Rhopalosiphum padi]|uniref:uncharacterized protein LOC132918953 n=1 Tax=Rhopalosiphum padi TaxID=40932 RepID=UPI00298D9E56|nr:uncharacterized protein LOC132918953 [Rhopalosiphum padi]